jgi:hypothetical protein
MNNTHGGVRDSFGRQMVETALERLDAPSHAARAFREEDQAATCGKGRLKSLQRIVLAILALADNGNGAKNALGEISPPRGPKGLRIWQMASPFSW